MATQDAILRIAAKTSGIQEVRALQGALGGLEKTASSMKSAFAGIAVALGAVGTIQIGGDLIKAANDAELVSRRIQAVAGSFGEVAGVYDIAAKASRQFAIGQTEAQSSVSNLYNRLRPMGVTLEQIETMFMGVNKAAALGGLTALDTSEAFRQLSQAMGSGRLQGDELRSLGERMPAVLQAVAKVMGVTVGEVKKLGSEGAITTDVLIKATQELNKLTPPEPTALARYKQAVDDLATTLGVGLAPVITPAIQGLTQISQVLISGANWLKANKEAVKLYANEIGSALLVAAKFAGGIGGIVIAFKAYNAIVQTSMAVTKALVLLQSLTPAGAALALTGLVAGAYAVNQVEQKIKGIMKDLPTVDGGFASIGKHANEIATSVASAGSGLASAKPAADALAMSAEDRARLEKILADEVERAAVGYQQQSTLTSLLAKRAEDRGKAAQDQLSIEEAQIGVAKAYLDNRLALATSDQERRTITLEIIELDKKAAAAQYQATLAQIQVEKDLSNLRTLEAERKLRQSLEELRIAEALGVVTAEIQAKAQSARSALMSTAVENAGIEKSLAARTQVAALNYQAAQIGLQGRTQQAGGPGPSPQIRNYVNVGGMKIPQYADTVDTGPTTTDKPRSYVTIAGMRIPQYAQGGFVTRRTLAEIGEGGEPEYVVPQSKAKGFANNILRGVVGGAALSSSGGGGGGGGGASSTKQYGYATDRYGNKWSLDPAAYRGKSFRVTAYDTSEEVGSPRWQLRMSQMKTGTTSKKSTFSGPGGMSGMKKLQRAQTQAPRIIIQTGPVQRRNDGDSVTLSDLEQAVASAVDQTMAAVQKTARQPGFKRRTGTR